MIWSDVRVFANARRLLAAVALAGCTVAGAAPAAQADLQADAKRAGAVFTGTVTDASRAGSQRPATVTYDVRVDRVYKGNLSVETV